MFITFIFTKLISLLWRGMKFMYYFWILAATITMYVIFLTQALKMENSYLYYIVAEFTLLLFIVPECTSYWTHYIVTTYIDDVEVGHYFTKEYTSGTLVKLGFMTLGTAIFSLISYFGHETGFIVIFIGHCVYLGIMFLVGLVGYIKNG